MKEKNTGRRDNNVEGERRRKRQEEEDVNR